MVRNKGLHFPSRNAVGYESQKLISRAIGVEDQNALLREERRRKAFIRILANEYMDIEIYFRCIIYGLGTLISSMLPTLAFTLIPAHNIFTNPAYWYEYLIQVTCFVIPSFAANNLIRSSFYINMPFLKSHRNFQKTFLVLVIVFVSLQAFFFISWTKVARFCYPLPFNGYLSLYFVILTSYIIIWYLIPNRWRKNCAMRKRLVSMIIALAMNQFLLSFYLVILKIMLSCNRKYQWVTALSFPIFREFSIWLSTKYARKAAMGDVRCAEIICHQAMCSSHAFVLAYTVGSIATIETTVVIISIDFFINVFICLRIIYAKRKKTADLDIQIKLLQELIINEIVEFMVPLSYLGCLTVGFYGPNSELIGDIRNGYWQYSPIEDIEHAIIYVLAFFLIDFGSLLISIVLLWTFCRINVLAAFTAIYKEFGLAFTVQIGLNLTGVREISINYWG